MEIIPYKDAHFYQYLATLAPQDLTPFRLAKEQIRDGDQIVTWMDGNKVLALGGVTKLWEGSGEAWILLDQSALRYPIAVRKMAIRYLSEAREQYWRIQATVKADFREGVRFALSLGFSLKNPKGEPMRRYGVDGGDYYMLEMLGVDPWAQQQ